MSEVIRYLVCLTISVLTVWAGSTGAVTVWPVEKNKVATAISRATWTQAFGAEGVCNPVNMVIDCTCL